jgi:hypothetical protein
MRSYLHNVSLNPQSGKYESYRRTLQEGTGFLYDLLKKSGITHLDGSELGSGEFMVKTMNEKPTHRFIAWWDEMSELWVKNRASGCTLEKKLLTLFESTSAAQGSFKNGVSSGNDFHLSLVGDFTKDGFDASFTGSGSRGSGYLSRCIFQFSDKQPCVGDWQATDTGKVKKIVSDIEGHLGLVVKQTKRFVPTESAEAKKMRLDFYAWLDSQDARYIPRLKDHLKRDLLLRSVFSGDVADNVSASGNRSLLGNLASKEISIEMMNRSIQWCKNQLDNRLALFPEDAGSPTEAMERTIIRALKHKATSVRLLKIACHVNRAGSGGHETFNRALRSLIFSKEIKPVGKTRKGMPVYDLS